MSHGYDATHALNQSLREQLDQLTLDATERLDRLIMGDEVFEHSRDVASEVRQLERERELELYRLAVRLSKRNRGET